MACFTLRRTYLTAIFVLGFCGTINQVYGKQPALADYVRIFRSLDQQSSLTASNLVSASRNMENGVTDNKRELDDLESSAKANGDLLTMMRVTRLARSTSEALICLSELQQIAVGLQGDLHTLYFALSFTSLATSKFDQDTGLDFVRLQADTTSGKLHVYRKTISGLSTCGNSTSWSNVISSSSKITQAIIDSSDQQIRFLSGSIGHSKY